MRIDPQTGQIPVAIAVPPAYNEFFLYPIMRKPLLIALTALLAAAAAAAAVSASSLELTAVRVPRGPKIDGRLDDEVWKSAAPFSGFRMAEPTPNVEPSETTELRILYDESSLYLGVLCRDREPSRIAANTMAHDGAGGGTSGMGFGHMPESATDDLVRVLLDPFKDNRMAYIFFVNPRGARGEGLASGGSASLNWDGIWEADSVLTEDGWSAEFRIPFKTLSFKPGLDLWGLNVERVIARKQEKIRLAGTNRDSIFNNPMEAAGLRGIEGVQQGKGITIRPYGLGRLETGRSGGLDGGLDVYKNFTPNFVGVFSYNMDFAETEADERRINLTRFPLFFPEKRMFFLEGSEIFNFSSSISFRPFFSRTIGLSGGNQIPVLWGAKAYGKIGRTNLAVLDVQTGAYEGLAGRNLLAARMTQDIFAESKLGWIFTSGSPTGARNSLAGMDFQYASSKFLGNKNIRTAAWGAYNWNDEPGRHHAFGFRADYPNNLWDIQSTYAYYGEALNPGLGYMMRRGIQTGFIRVGFQPRPAAGGFLDRIARQFFFDFSADYYWDLAGNLETRRLSGTPFSLRTESGETLRFSVTSNRDVLLYNFEVAEGVVLPARGYDFTSLQISLNTASHRPFTLTSSYAFGGFYSGHYDDIKVGFMIKFDGYASLSLDSEFVRGRLPEGRFTENVYQLKADFFLSPDLGWMNYIQFDDISKLLGWSSRLRWQISPGNEIYLVYNKGWERRWDPSSRFVPLDERGVLKLTFSIRP